MVFIADTQSVYCAVGPESLNKVRLTFMLKELRNARYIGSYVNSTSSKHTGWRTKCHTIDCTHNTLLFLQKNLTSGTELILIGWQTS